MKCDYAWLKKEFSKIRDEITRNYVLSTLAKSDEELQQLFNEAEGEIEDTLYVPYEGVTYKVMDEDHVKALVKHLKKVILGENQT